MSSEAGGKQPAEFECDVLQLQSLGALSSLGTCVETALDSLSAVPPPLSALCPWTHHRCVNPFCPSTPSRLSSVHSQHLCSFLYLLFLDHALVHAALLLFFSFHLYASYCSPPLLLVQIRLWIPRVNPPPFLGLLLL